MATSCCGFTSNPPRSLRGAPPTACARAVPGAESLSRKRSPSDTAIKPDGVRASLKPGRDLVAIDIGAGAGAPDVAHEHAGFVFVGGFCRRQLQHGGIVRLHFHPRRM